MLAKECLAEFKLDCELRRLSPRTVKGYYNNCALCFNYLEKEHNVVGLEDIRSLHLKAYFQYLISKGLSPSYANGVLKSVRAFFRYVIEEGYISENVALKVRWQKEGKVLINTFSDEEVRKLINAFNEPTYLSVRNKLILAIAFDTGARNSEICDITCSDIRCNVILLHGKGNKERHVAVLMLLAGIDDVRYSISNLFRWFDNLLDWGIFDSDTILSFLYTADCMLAAIGFLSTAVILLANKRTELLRLTPYFICGSFAVGVVENVITLIVGWGNPLGLLKSVGLVVVWLVVVLAADSQKYTQAKVKEIILTIVIVILGFLDFVETINYYGDFTDFLLFRGTLDYIAMVFVVWIWPHVYGQKKSDAIHESSEVKQMEYNDTTYTNQQAIHEIPEIDGYVKIWKLIVFTFLTLGIYTCIWTYRTVGLFNRKRIGEEKSQGVQLVLCMFVPFYSIYWLYKYSKLTEEYTLRVGNRSNDLAILSLILSIFGFQLIAMALLQDQINKNLKREYGVQEVKAETRPVYTQTTAETKSTTEERTDRATGRMSNDDIDYLMKLKQLLDAGILTEEEYSAKKEQVLNSSKK